MTAVITLLNAGTDTGPFNLYSNLDGFTTAFETNVSRVALLAGYSATTVPDYTAFIRVQSMGSCSNYLDIPVTNTPVTADVPCGNTQYSGSGDVYPAIWTIDMGSELGWVVFHYTVATRFAKFIVTFDGNTVINSGYRGWAPSYPYSDSSLNSAIVAKGDAPENVVGYETGSVWFYKDTSTPIVTLTVYSPMVDSSWNFRANCPSTTLVTN